jgi:hypothetical protein
MHAVEEEDEMRSLVGPPVPAAASGIQAPEGASSTWSGTGVVARIQPYLHASRFGFSLAIDPSPSPSMIFSLVISVTISPAPHILKDVVIVFR